MILPNRQSTLDQWIDWLLHLHAEEIDLGLDRIRLVADVMQVRKPAPLVITVAGTNGKGSSVAMLVAILKSAGYQVGSYTSPHIQRFNERIQINSQPVNDEVIINAFAEIEVARAATKLTYFEFSTLAALSIFKNSNLDVVVLEVGLGGRLDAVNVVDADAALITAIDIDHIEWLGSDRSVIATEKAGVTRAGKTAVCSDPNPPESLNKYVQDKKVPLKQLGCDFSIEMDEVLWSLAWHKDKPDCDSKLYTGLPLPALKGAFQLQNAAGVVALLSQLTGLTKVDSTAVRKGLLVAKHPGRLEQMTIAGQDWLIDVAHNPQSAKALSEFLQAQKQSGSVKKYTAIFSVLSDKDAEPMIRVIAPYIEHWIVADLAIPRATPLNDLKALLIKSGVPSEAISGEDSIALAAEKALNTDCSKVLVWGSFFTVAQVYNELAVDQSTTDKLVSG